MATIDLSAIMADVRTALRVTTIAFDLEIEGLMLAAIEDLRVAGVVVESIDDNPLVVRAIITYCKANFGQPDEYDRLKASYDEQKAQLVTATGHTVWEVG